MMQSVGTQGARPTAGDIMTKDLLAIVDDAQLHAAIVARRERLRAEQVLLTRWAGVVAKRMRQSMTQQELADTVRLSRTAVRKKLGEP